ncbi:MAG: serine--tRNA ligase [Candidatus Levybacteria bacterium]|nr:serine--tRNA ligase [Candidatus Levybacteria bacterium]
MLDIKFIRENPKRVQEAARNKGVDIDIMHVLEIDYKYRELSQLVQRLREERNRLSKEKNIEAGKKLKDELEKQEHALKAVEEELQTWVYKIPNIPKKDVKIGKDELENEVIKKHGEPKKFSFAPKDHVELGKILDIIDIERAAKMSGARFGFLKNDAVLLEFALVQFAIDSLLKENFTPIIPPVLVKPEIMQGLGYAEHGADEDMFVIPKDNFVLIGTAEHAIVAMHKNEILQSRILPLRYVGFSTAFRREAGSYGKDTKGIFRVHQFDKVEMVSFVAEGEDDKEHEYLLSLEEKFFQQLQLPYQVVKMCTGDVGFPAARKFDLEAWIPSQEKFREVTSVSTVTDFQSRRLNIRYQDSAKQNEKKFVNILNGTAFAIGRTIVAILENYQQEDGSVVVPQVLQKYIGKSAIKPHR